MIYVDILNLVSQTLSKTMSLNQMLQCKCSWKIFGFMSGISELAVVPCRTHGLTAKRFKCCLNSWTLLQDLNAVSIHFKSRLSMYESDEGRPHLESFQTEGESLQSMQLLIKFTQHLFFEGLTIGRLGWVMGIHACWMEFISLPMPIPCSNSWLKFQILLFQQQECKLIWQITPNLT